MNQKEKAHAFDLVVSGQVTGMSMFWKNYDKLRGLPNNEILEKMARFACEEAVDVMKIEETP
jgi:hypothetical protein